MHSVALNFADKRGSEAKAKTTLVLAFHMDFVHTPSF